MIRVVVAFIIPVRVIVMRTFPTNRLFAKAHVSMLYSEPLGSGRFRDLGRLVGRPSRKALARSNDTIGSPQN